MRPGPRSVRAGDKDVDRAKSLAARAQPPALGSRSQNEADPGGDPTTAEPAGAGLRGPGRGPHLRRRAPRSGPALRGEPRAVQSRFGDRPNWRLIAHRAGVLPASPTKAGLKSVGLTMNSAENRSMLSSIENSVRGERECDDVVAWATGPACRSPAALPERRGRAVGYLTTCPQRAYRSFWATSLDLMLRLRVRLDGVKRERSRA